MEGSKILDLLDESPNIMPVTPPNTDVETMSENAELVLPSLIDGREISLKDLQKMNQVISFSGTDISNTPSTKDYSSDKEQDLNVMKHELRGLKYKLICLDMRKREIEEDNYKLHDDLEAQHYDINKLKRELTELKEENIKLEEYLLTKEGNNNSLIFTLSLSLTATLTIFYKYYRDVNQN